MNQNNQTVLLNSILFNFIYLASSRSIDKLVFIEEKKSTLAEEFSNYINETSINNLLIQESTISTEEDWMIEGYYLKRIGKYDQAMKAFELADNKKEVQICKNILARKLNYELLHDYQLIIKFNWTVQSKEEIINALLYLKDEYNWDIRGHIKHYVSSSSENYIKDYFIHEDQEIYGLADLIERNTNHRAALKSNIFFTGCIYFEDKPIHLNSDTTSSLHGIYINNNNGKYSIKSVRAELEQEIINLHNKQEKLLKDVSDAFDDFIVEPHLENNNLEKTAEEHLSDIFE